MVLNRVKRCRELTLCPWLRCRRWWLMGVLNRRGLVCLIILWEMYLLIGRPKSRRVVLMVRRRLMKFILILLKDRDLRCGLMNPLIRLHRKFLLKSGVRWDRGLDRSLCWSGLLCRLGRLSTFITLTCLFSRLWLSARVGIPWCRLCKLVKNVDGRWWCLLDVVVLSGLICCRLILRRRRLLTLIGPMVNRLL